MSKFNTHKRTDKEKIKCLESQRVKMFAEIEELEGRLEKAKTVIEFTMDKCQLYGPADRARELAREWLVGERSES